MKLPQIPAVILKGGTTYKIPQLKELYQREVARQEKPKAK